MTAVVSDQPDEAAALADRLGPVRARGRRRRDPGRRTAHRAAPRRRPPPDRGLRHRRHPVLGPARRPCSTSPATGDVVARPRDRLDRRHPRGAARRPRHRGRRARPHLLRRPAAAAGAGPRAGRRPGDPGPGRADLRGRRPHRGPDRRAAARPPRAGRTTVVVTSSPLVLDAVDEVAFLRGGRVVATGTHARPARERRRLPRRRDPREHEPAVGVVRHEPVTSTARCPIADSRSLRRYVRGLARRHPRLLWTALALHVARRPGRAGRAPADRRPRPGRRRGHHGRPRRPDHPRAGGVPGRPDGADPVRPADQPGARRAGAGRAARGLRRQRARAAGRRRRVGRLRRPAHPDQPRRRPARLVGALGAARVDDRGRHRGGHLRRGDHASAGGCCCRSCSACRRWWSGCAGTSPAPRTATCASPRRTPRSTRPSPRPSRAPARSRRSGSGRERIAAIDADVKESYDAERYTLYLRTVFFPSMELSYLIPTVATLLLGGYLYTQGSVTLGEVTTATLYVQMLIDPVDRIVSILDELQMGAASLARLLGVAQVPDDREVTGAEPVGEKLDARDVRFSYVDGRDVLHGVDLDVGVGERIAMVGPSGRRQVDAGPAAGRHPPAAHRRGDRRRRRPGRAAARRPARPRRPGDPGAPRLRRHPAREPRAGRASGRHRRRHPRRAVGGRRPRVGRGAARGARHRRRLRRPRAHRRPGPADRAGPAGARRPAHAGPRRGHLADRPARRPAPRALAGRRTRTAAP